MTTGNNQGGAGLDRYLPAVPADWAPPVRTVGDALDQLGARGGGAGFATSYVWRPLGVAAPGVYVTWAALVAAFAVVDNAARKTVSVDDSLGNAHVTTGSWGVENVEFRSGGSDLSNGSIATVNIDQGAVFTGTSHLSFDNIIVNDARTSGALVTTGAGADLSVDLRSTAFRATGGAPSTFALGAGSELSLKLYATSQLGDGTHPIVSGSATSAALVFAFCESIVADNAFNLTAGGAIEIAADGSCLISATQTPAPSIVILDPTPTFVFQPGGTAGGNVYVTWASMMAAAALFSGPKLIEVDDNLGAAHVTATATPWNLDQVTLTSAENTTTGGAAKLIFDAGSAVTFGVLRLGFILTQNACAAPCFVTTHPEHRIYLTEGAGFMNTGYAGSSEWADIATGTTLFLSVLQGSQFGDGTNAVAKLLAAGSSLLVRLRDLGCTFNANAVSGGVGTFSASVADDATMSATQSPAPAITFSAKASQLGYTPATGANWNPVPTLANAALDQLAVSNTVSAAGNTGTGAGTVTVTTGNITKKKSGQMVVSASCLLSTSATAMTLTLQLKRDAANIGTAKSLVVPVAGIPDGIDISIDAVDTAPDNAAHTYTLSVSASAGTLTVAANSAQIQVVEDS